MLYEFLLYSFLMAKLENFDRPKFTFSFGFHYHRLTAVGLVKLSQEREFSMIIIASQPDMFRSCFLKVFELQRVETFQTTHKTHFTDICIHILIFTYQNTQFLKNKSLSSTTFMLRL